MRRAWHVVRPRDTNPGCDERNFVAQKQYDGLFYDYEHLSAEERNAMVVEMQRNWPFAQSVRGLRAVDGGEEWDHAD